MIRLFLMIFGSVATIVAALFLIVLLKACGPTLHGHQHQDAKVLKTRKMYHFVGKALPEQAFECGSYINVDLPYSFNGLYIDPDGCKYQGKSTEIEYYHTVYY